MAKLRTAVLLFACLLVYQLAVPPDGYAIDYVWTGASTNDWESDANWNPVGYPHNNFDSAHIDNNSGKTSTVNFSSQYDYYAINMLTVDEVDSLIIKDGNHINLYGNLLNNGTILIDGSANTTHLVAMGTTSNSSGIHELSGSGSLLLNGNLNSRLTSFGGGSFQNMAGHTIGGGGYIMTPLKNLGLVEASNGIFNGILIINRDVDNAGGVMRATPGNTLRFHSSSTTGGQVLPNGGIVELFYDVKMTGLTLGAGTVNVLDSSTFAGGINSSATINISNSLMLSFYGDQTFTNQGVVNVNDAHMRANQAEVTLAGSGIVSLNGPNSYLSSFGADSKFINQAGHTIQGRGTISSNVLNYGTILANNGTLRISGTITGTGNIIVQGASNSEFAILDLNTGLTAGNLHMNEFAKLLANDRTINLTGSFTFAQKNESSWDWGATGFLEMTGGGLQQRLEIGGHDYGSSSAGYSNNFDLNQLRIDGTNTLVFLTDWIDNGNRSSNEALYLDALYVGPGASLNLILLHLYVNGYGLVEIPVGGFITWENGGGTIINQFRPVPLPGSVLLLGLALLGRWRKWG